MTAVNLNDGNWKAFDFSESFCRSRNKDTESKLLATLVKVRHKKKITQKVLAQKANVSWQTITHLENNRRNTSLKSFIRLAEALGLEIKLVPKKVR